MAPEPQRSEQKRPLSVSLIPLERALRARADDLHGRSMAARWHGEDIPPELGPVYRAMAAEFRALADELSHW